MGDCTSTLRPECGGEELPSAAGGLALRAGMVGGWWVTCRIGRTSVEDMGEACSDNACGRR